jgi:hypothetical protein
VPTGVAVAGFALSLLPPWALPGIGVLFVLAHLLARGLPGPAPRTS